MGRQRRTRILIDGDPALSRVLCEQIETVCVVRTVSAPREVLVMNRVRESARGSLFYLGETLLTECKVVLNEVMGIGLVLGSHYRCAFELAVIDAAFSQPSPLPQLSHWVVLLEQEEQLIAVRETELRERLNRTRVDFTDMSTAGMGAADTSAVGMGAADTSAKARPS
jgi:alpha-D-ribose 1-methylphosphonate 5-triphosphate synthase subunit PhnG